MHICKSFATPSISKYIRFSFAQDWSHLYNNIYKFEDNTLGEETLAIREQALDFAKKKLSPFAMEWEKNAYFPV